jgi:DNA-binding response OmpR family regulator
MSNTPIKVLLLDDDLSDAQLIWEMLTYAKGPMFQVVWADRLSTGMKRLGGEPVDAVLLKLVLLDDKGLDGFESLRAQAPEVPLILLVTTEEEHLAREAVAKGAQDYLVKWQVDSRAVVRSIEAAIQRNRTKTEVSRALSSAQASSRLSQDLLAKASQRLGSPLDLILNMAELLLETDLTADQEKQVGIIKGAGQVLLSVADTLIHFTRRKLEPLPVASAVASEEMAAGAPFALETVEPAIPVRARKAVRVKGPTGRKLAARRPSSPSRLHYAESVN